MTADYDAETAVERELVLRLASLLWRLRWATSIETGLLQRQGENIVEHSRAKQLGQADNIQSDATWCGERVNNHDDVGSQADSDYIGSTVLST